MRGAIPPLPLYAFMAWCLVKKKQGQLYLYLFLKALTALRGPLAYPNGLLDLHIDIW
jgi:hypothetical protein